ncbi:sulfite exporter TauE/SafE family protein [Anaeromicrobium sediminis]|uniref:Probable membrane transporter protein n=1 Tax=Anaeromicrobium sediminis TaxID=1478221 RepID=A0A267MHI4_9FIRM|nr:sulfite exporter TauE/SafE family protein [Anaeromicrobium sediminis]PAB58986.1 permease [Anaeromicrobium sediminis]
MFYIVVGLFSGIMGGMGIGGGTILIPALIIFTTLNQQQSQGLNLLCFIPAAIVAFITHLKGGNIETKFCIPLIIAGLLGAFLGANMAIRISSDLLRRLFGIFLFLMALYEFFYKGKK